MNLLTFDFGGTTVKYTLWQTDKLLTVFSFPTPKTWEETKERLLEIKADYEKDYQLHGAAFSFPGCIDHHTGEIKGNSAIKYIHHFPIQRALSELLNLPVSMENDANCAALAEVWRGVAKDAENVLFVVVGTGVGGAIVIDGKIHAGANLYGGEFGFMYLDHTREPRYRTLSGLGTAVCMAERYCNQKEVPHGTYSGKDVFELAKQEDMLAVSEVETFHKYLSIGLFNLQMSFDPEIIVIGGGISANTEIVERLTIDVNDLIEKAGVIDFKAQILPCFYKNDANLMGAVKNFFARLELDS